MRNILKDKHVCNFLDDLHKTKVIVNADKASNNIIVVCKKYYLECIIKEWKIDNNEKPNINNTYQYINKTEKDIVHKHNLFMNKNNIIIDDKMRHVPNLYAIPKMHKLFQKWDIEQRQTNGLQKISHNHKMFKASYNTT